MHICFSIQSLESLDNGKPYKVAYHGDICYFAKFMRYYAGWCDKVTGQTIPVGQYSTPRIFWYMILWPYIFC